ncbi:MFS transporter [Paenibacillus sp. J31TS4]|uniref:MFS transporter n=1 Tax=Paenibacillus sp. J31TS4 TaxID=2807195 RepID=UPI001BD0B8B5|nr:MFS transporter [Paenibacillus sp. J31TS4]
MSRPSFVSAYPKESWYFLIASFVNSLGSSFMWPLTTLYVHNVLHRSYGEAGLVLLLQSIASIVGQLAGGSLYHRIGVKPLIVGSLLLGGTAQLSLIAVREWPFYIAVMMTIGFLNAISMPAIQAYVGFRWKEQRRKLFNLIYVGNNLGMAIGTSIAGVLAAMFSFTVNFTVNSVSTLGFGLFFLFFLKQTVREPQGEAAAVPGGGKPVYEKTTWQLLGNVKLYLFMALGSMLVWFSTSVWNSGVAPYLDEQGRGMASYSFLWTVNGIVIFAGQPLLALLKRYLARSLPAQLIACSMLYATGFSLILLSQSYSMMITGMVITTFGEMLLAPTVPAFLTEKAGRYSPFYLGLVGAIGTFGRLAGPYTLGTTYDHGGVHPVLAIAALAPVVATVFYVIHASFHREPRKSEAAVPLPEPVPES